MSRCTVLLAIMACITLASPTHARKAKKAGPALSDAVLALHPDILAMRARVAASPQDAALHNDLGTLYGLQGWDDLALDAFREAIRLDPSLYSAWTNIGTIENKRGRLDAAATAFQAAIDIEPRAALAHYNLGVVRERQGSYDQALASYKTAVTLDPDLLDPGANPQIVNNRHETVIRLLKYLEETGSSSLPLETVGTGAQHSGSDSSPLRPAGALPSADDDSNPWPPDGTASLSPGNALPNGEPGRHILGSLKMYTGRAARRLEAQADARRAPESAASPGSHPPLR
ncbi:MAG: tetratricopeptide repeat protein [Acidobacteriota bacterium]